MPAAAAETVLLTALALIAFAGNSLLTRLALAGGHLDAASFTAVRLGSGALVLVAIVAVRARGWAPLRGGGRASALALFGYAAPFTFAYLRIGAAVGALVLFGTVQLTMIGRGIARGERPAPPVWAGLALAAGGLAALMLPAAHRPDLLGLALMVVAGVCWGVYSLLGKTAPDPLAANARAFLGSLPLALFLAAASLSVARLSARGLLLAGLSGGVTSGLGYAIWYRALRGLSATQAAVVQLSVPVIAALGAALLLGERLTARLVVCAAIVIGGVALALAGRSSKSKSN
jgi:drug/metabolite transporter (DMT)-like permease